MINTFSDYYQYIRDFSRHNSNSEKVDMKLVEKYTNKYIGGGFYDRLKEFVIFSRKRRQSINKAKILESITDIIHSNVQTVDVMLDIGIMSGDYDKIGVDDYYKYNSWCFYIHDEDNIINIINSLIYDFMYSIGEPRRDLMFEILEKHPLCDINPLIFYTLDNKVWEYSKLEHFNIDNFLSMYVPCVVLRIGNEYGSNKTVELDSFGVKLQLDKHLDKILNRYKIGEYKLIQPRNFTYTYDLNIILL